MILRLAQGPSRTYAYAANFESSRDSRISKLLGSVNIVHLDIQEIVANETALAGLECSSKQATQRPADADERPISMSQKMR